MDHVHLTGGQGSMEHEMRLGFFLKLEILKHHSYRNLVVSTFPQKVYIWN